jgi:OOP family OmpA-OmpF porin
MKRITIFLFFMFILLNYGCVSQYLDFLPETHYLNKRNVLKPIPGKYDFTESVNKGDFSPKIHQFIFILDASTSMSESSAGRLKYDVAKDLLYRMIQMIPDIYSFKTLKASGHKDTAQFRAGLNVFGSRGNILKGTFERVIPIDKFSRKQFEMILKQSRGRPIDSKSGSLIEPPSGESPMHLAIDASIVDLKRIETQTAIIIISDWKELSSKVIPTVHKVFQTFGENISLHNIFVGDDLMAKSHMESIANISKNAYSYCSKDLISNEKLNRFVEKVFLKNNRPIDPIIPFVEKLKELCQRGTGLINPEDALVMPIHFDLDKYYIKKEYFHDLKIIIEALNEYPDVCMKLSGHTDDLHTWEYNLNLSQKRAEAVKQYLVDHGLINADRITTEGFAFQYPYDKTIGNTTPEARAKNRRTEITRIDCQ